MRDGGPSPTEVIEEFSSWRHCGCIIEYRHVGVVWFQRISVPCAMHGVGWVGPVPWPDELFLEYRVRRHAGAQRIRGGFGITPKRIP